jgi:hypothetical protein
MQQQLYNISYGEQSRQNEAFVVAFYTGLLTSALGASVYWPLISIPGTRQNGF